MKYNVCHRDIVLAFENIYSYTLKNNFSKVSFNIENTYFLNGRFHIGSYSFYFSYCSLEFRDKDEVALLVSYKSIGSNVITKRFACMGDFIEFLDDAFINV